MSRVKLKKIYIYILKIVDTIIRGEKSTRSHHILYKTLRFNIVGYWTQHTYKYIYMYTSHRPSGRVDLFLLSSCLNQIHNFGYLAIGNRAIGTANTRAAVQSKIIIICAQSSLKNNINRTPNLNENAHIVVLYILILYCNLLLSYLHYKYYGASCGRLNSYTCYHWLYYK